MNTKTGLKSRAMRALGVSTILSTLVLPMAAYAAEPQDAPVPSADPAEDQSGGLGEIIVTATRDATSIQKVPISMQALSTEVLAQRQIKGLTDFAALLPSVTFAGIGPGRNTPYFRGIVPAGGARESVGYYIDDIPITGTGLPDVQVYDIARIEALSGPQGTLYGAGSLAGTIRFISNKPKLDTFEFGYDAEVNKYGKGDFGGQYQTFINVPVSSTLAVRAMAELRDRLVARPALLDHVEALADLELGACLVFDSATRQLSLIANAPLTIETDSGAIRLSPGETAHIPAGVKRLRHAHVAIDLEREAPR